jgi:hypothetical protein
MLPVGCRSAVLPFASTTLSKDLDLAHHYLGVFGVPIFRPGEIRGVQILLGSNEIRKRHGPELRRTEIIS